MDLWESGETQWHLLCWSHFFFLLFSFSVKGKIKSNTSFQCLPHCSSFSCFLPPLLFLLLPAHPFPSLSHPRMTCVCMFDISVHEWVCVSRHMQAKTDTIVLTKGNLFARLRGYGNRPPRETLEGTAATICGQSCVIALLEEEAPTRWQAQTLLWWFWRQYYQQSCGTIFPAQLST